MCEPTSWLITRCVMMFLRMLSLKSSQFSPCAADGLFQIFHALELVAGANRIEPFDHFGLYAQPHVLAALDEEGLIDEVAEGVLAAFFDFRLQLFGGAVVLALLRGIFFGGGRELCPVRTG